MSAPKSLFDMQNMSEIMQNRSAPIDRLRKKESITEVKEYINVAQQSKEQSNMMIHKEIDDLELQTAKQEFEYNNDHIKSIMQKTGQHELNVGKCLTLVHDLLNATTETVSDSNKLKASISTFGELFEKQFKAGTGLSIEYYFNLHDLAQLVPTLAAEGYQCMTDLICDNEEEYSEIIDLFEKDKIILTQRECRLFKNICLKPLVWQRYQQKQAEATKYELDTISSLFSQFFLKLNHGLYESQQLLSYGRKLNSMQLQAVQKNRLPPAAENIDTQKRNDWRINSSCQVYSELHTKWFDAVIIDVTQDSEGEWLHVKYSVNTRLYIIQQIQRSSEIIRTVCDDTNSDTLISDCRALTVESLNRINITETLMENCHQHILTDRVLTIAREIENYCMEITRSQSKIRLSVLLIQEILKLKPVHMDLKSKQLWEAIDQAVVHIFTSALNMDRMSCEYFSYFKRFKQSLDHYHSYKEQSLFISLEHLRKDISDFSTFEGRFTQTVHKLTTEGKNCIQNLANCIIGPNTFEQFRRSRELSLKKWLAKKAAYDNKTVQLSVHSIDIHYEDSEQNKSNPDFDDEETDRFFTFLDDMTQFDDEKLYCAASTFSINIFQKYENAVNQLNKLIQRISRVTSTNLSEIKSEIISLPCSIGDNGYYSSKSDSSHVSQQEWISNRHKLLIRGFIRRIIDNNSTANFIIMITVEIIAEIMSRCKKSRRKKKRKKKNKNHRKLSSQQTYEPNINTVSNMVHMQAINEWILTQKWYDKTSIKDATLHGTTISNGRITLSLEVSEFMRRCQRIVTDVANKKKDINLIPITMKDFNNNLSIYYVWMIEIDTVHHIDIGISFQCVQAHNIKSQNVIFTGIHLNPTLLSHQYESNGLRIGYLNIYSQTKEHFEDRYNQLKSFIRGLINCDVSKFNLLDWQRKAQKLWNEVIGTSKQL